jgi:hypothetical protein
MLSLKKANRGLLGKKFFDLKLKTWFYVSIFFREEEHDIDEDDERISFDVLEKSNREKQATRDNFLAYEQGLLKIKQIFCR